MKMLSVQLQRKLWLARTGVTCASRPPPRGWLKQPPSSKSLQPRARIGLFWNRSRLHCARLSGTPGQHALVLVSPGFVAPSREQDFSQLIDQALHSDIIISILDARGLYYLDSVAQPRTANLQYRRESALANGETLRTLANATGGTSVQNSNDFLSGFTRVAQAPEYYYVLGFSPQDDQLDGRFHNLTVALNNGEKLTLQSRKGYYARKR
jgi:VWFA-related protein